MKIKRAYFTYGVAKAADELADEVIRFIHGTGADGGVVGLSGGIDSTTVAYLCKYAFDNVPEKKLKLYGVIMPSEANDVDDEKDGLRVAESLGIKSIVIPIEALANAFVSEIPEINTKFHRGNLYAELRAIILSRIAAAKNCRIMGTGNWDEDYVLGYFTKRGDGAVDNNILGNLPKRLVRELAKHLGVESDLVNRISTAGLWEGQTDEGELGYDYEQSENVQRGIDQGFTPEKVREITGYDKWIIDDVILRHRTTEHKRKVPPVGKVNLNYR